MTSTPRPRGPYKRQPHPMEPQIRTLLTQGLNNAQITEQLNAPPRVVARVRAEAGITRAAHSTWRRRPHPKTPEINDLLGYGYSNAEIRRRTGADVDAIARMRADGGYGKPTVARKSRPHPREAEIRTLLPQYSSDAIARLLGVDRAAVRRVRAGAGIPYTGGSYTSAEEKWRAPVRPVDGGHLEWTGERGSASGTPVMRYREKSYSPAGIAFRIRHGREPEGYARAECGLVHCVAPEHVDDTVTRTRDRAALAALTGRWHRLETECRRGHDYAQHGRYLPDGSRYCDRCHLDGKQARKETAS